MFDWFRKKETKKPLPKRPATIVDYQPMSEFKEQEENLT